MFVDYIEKVANEKRFDVILVPYDSFDPGQFEVISKLIKRGTDIVPVMFGVHYRTKEKCPFIGLEKYSSNGSAENGKKMERTARPDHRHERQTCFDQRLAD